MNACTELIIWGELTKKLSIRVNGYSVPLWAVIAKAVNFNQSKNNFY